MTQIARNLTDADDGVLKGKSYLLVDRDLKFCDTFRELIEQQGTECVRLPPRSPNLNAHVERFMRSIKEECLSKLILFGEASLPNAVQQFLEHYHQERPHQGLGNRILQSSTETRSDGRDVECRERLGGTLRFYHRLAA
jgi:transposase InsO family protein